MIIHTMIFKLLLIISTSLVFVHSLRNYERRSRENVYNPQRFVRSHCWSQMDQLTQNMRQATCKPRETLVDVVTEAANIMIFPNKVAVKRCDGGTCYGQAACLPVETQEISFAVRMHDFRTGREFCGSVQVIEHTKCKCGCPVMAHHCTERQEYRPKECMCSCLNDGEKNTCLQQGKIWDQTSCSCVCQEMFPECSTGTEWVPSMCKCMRIMMEQNNEVYDSEDPFSTE